MHLKAGEKRKRKEGGEKEEGKRGKKNDYPLIIVFIPVYDGVKKRKEKREKKGEEGRRTGHCLPPLLKLET